MDDAKALIAASPLKILACDDLDEAAKMVHSKTQHHKRKKPFSFLTIICIAEGSLTDDGQWSRC